MLVTNPLLLVTTRSIGTLDPCLTESVPMVGLETNVKLCVVAVIVKATLVELEAVPEVPVTVKVSTLAAILACVAIVSVVVPLPPVTGLAVHVTPVGELGQLKVTVPVNPF